MDYRLTLFFLIHCLVQYVSSQCSLLPLVAKSKNSMNVLSKLNSAKISNSRTFTNVTKDENGKDQYTYTLYVCPKHDGKADPIGLTQARMDNSKTTVIGRYNESNMHLNSQGNLITLIYTLGDNYTVACQKDERRAIILMRCSATLQEARFEAIQESAGKGEDFCYYIFELVLPQKDASDIFSKCSVDVDATSSAAAEKSANAEAQTHAEHKGLGGFSIFMILVLVGVGLFFVLGSVYKRYARGAQGWEQMPFIDFWRRCGQSTTAMFNRGGRQTRAETFDDYASVDASDRTAIAADRQGDDHLLHP